MNRRSVKAVGVVFCVMVPLLAASGCGKNDAGAAATSAAPVQLAPPANVPPAVQQRRAAEAQGRAEDAKRAASSAGAKFRQ